MAQCRNGAHTEGSPAQAEINTPAAGGKVGRRSNNALFVLNGIAFGMIALTLPFILPAFRKICLPYVPATSEQIKVVLRLLKGGSGPVVDLGSGDGRLVSSNGM